MCQPEEVFDESASHHSQDHQVFAPLSLAAVHGRSAPRTIQFQGLVQGVEALILLDSGSSHSFVSTTLAAQLSGASEIIPAIQVKVADGGVTLCTTQFLDLAWSIQGYQFISDSKVFPITQFDMIISMDWLEQFSPMQVHWKDKWLRVLYGSSSALLSGLHSEARDLWCSYLSSLIQLNPSHQKHQRLK